MDRQGPADAGPWLAPEGLRRAQAHRADDVFLAAGRNFRRYVMTHLSDGSARLFYSSRSVWYNTDSSSD